MKQLFLFLVILTFFGCEEIIELDLNSTDTKIIIEANLTNSLEKNFVKITESTDYFTPNTYNTISNAIVTIKENNGEIYTLEETTPGLYKNDRLIAISHKQYIIEVNKNNKKYSATSNVPTPNIIDSLGYILEKRPFGKGKKTLQLHVYFQDNIEHNDFVRFVVYLNGKKINNIFLYKDRLTNGNYIDFFFFNFRDIDFKKGDILSVEMHSIDEQTFNYFNTLKSALASKSGGPFSTTAPANPITNWSNNAFGYFSAFTINSDSIELK